MVNILFIIPPERFRDEELFVTKTELEKAGHKTTVASTKKGTCLGSRGGIINSFYFWIVSYYRNNQELNLR